MTDADNMERRASDNGQRGFRGRKSTPSFLKDGGLKSPGEVFEEEAKRTRLEPAAPLNNVRGMDGAVLPPVSVRDVPQPSFQPDALKAAAREGAVVHAPDRPPVKIPKKAAVAMGAASILAAMGFGGFKLFQNSNENKTDGGDGSGVNIIVPPPTQEQPTVTVQPTVNAEQPTEKPTPAPTPEPTVGIEREYKYKLGFSVEYKGPDVTSVLGIEQAVMDRPAGFTYTDTTSQHRVSKADAITSIGLSDTYLKQYATGELKNGLTPEQLLQYENDGIVRGHLSNLRELSTYKDMTEVELKRLIHEGKAPKYTVRLNDIPGSTEFITVDPAKPVHFIAIQNPGQVKLDTTDGFDYSLGPDGSWVIGVWSGTSFFKNYPVDQYHYDASALSYLKSVGMVLGTMAPSTSQAEGELARRTVLPETGFTPFKTPELWAGIAEVK